MLHKYLPNLILSLLSIMLTSSIILASPEKGQSAFEITNINVTHVSDCYGDETGSIEIQVSGGQAPYRYSIDDGDTFVQDPATSYTFNNLAAGTYIIVVKDDNDTKISDIKAITQPTQIHIDNITATHISGCHGDSNGEISITASEGTPPYTYSIDNGSSYHNNGGSFTGLSAGTYTIKVKDSNGCTKKGNTVTLSQPDELVINDIALQDVTGCYGNSNGNITIDAQGGTGTLLYTTDGTNFQSGAYFGGLPAGDYPVSIEDENNCTADGGTQTLTQPDELVINSENAYDVNTCHGDNSGRIEITATGGTGEIQYSIDDGFTSQTSDTFEDLYAGEYDIAVIDQNSCTVKGSSLTINEPPLLQITDTDTSHITGCYGDATGEIIITAAGGTAPLQYSIDSGDNFQGSGTFQNLAAGTYQVIVKDNNGCEKIGGNYFLEQPDKLIADNASTNDVNECYGDHTGSITMIAYGGTGDLEYSVDNGTTYDSDNIAAGLPAGTYYAKVRDQNNCTADFTQTLVINQPEEVVILTETPTDPTCYGTASGQIEITAQGGTGNFQYSANNGANYYFENIITGLSAGSYTIKVQDGNGCTADGSTLTLNDPPELLITDESYQNVSSCHGGSNGSISITAEGGTGDILYSIDGGINYSTTSDFTGLTAGLYNIMVKDDNNCITPGSQITLTQPAEVVINQILKTHIKGCKGEAIGEIEIQASGGTAPLQYSIDGGTNFYDNGGLFSNLAAGDYPLVVEDANGCTDYGNTVSITEPPELLFETTDSENVLCNGENNGKITLQATGGVSPYQYSIDGGTNFSASNAFSGLPAGNYQTQVKDYHDCIHTGPEIVISEPDEISINNVSKENVELCYGDKTGSINVEASGGTPALEYSVNNGKTFDANSGIFDNLPAGIYNIAVRDKNECRVNYSLSVEVTQPPRLQISEITSTDILCHGETNGTITITASGGTGTILYSNDGGENFTDNNGNFTDLTRGSYDIEIIDDNNCRIKETSVNISEPAPLKADTLVVKDERCQNSEDGSITFYMLGGVAPYNYSADAGNTFQNQRQITNLAPGNYQPAVVDANGCRIDLPDVTIGSPENSSLFTNTPQTGCSPLEVQFNKTETGDTYRWYFGDGSTSGTANPTHTFINESLSPNDYTVWSYALSENGCKDSSSTTIRVNPQPRLIFSTQTDTLYMPNSEFVISNESPSGYTDYFWDFGDGRSSSLEHPSPHSYDTCGTYTISVGARNNWCTDTTKRQVSVTAYDPRIELDADTTAGCFPAEINFSSTVQHSTNYLWDFDNGETSEEQNPSTLYEEVGNYRVTLSAQGYCGTYSEKDTLISVYDTPQIDFRVEPDSVMPPIQPIHCYNYSSGYELDYFWDFGDGNTSQEKSPIHYYLTPGEYPVTLTVISGHQCIDSLTRSKTVFVFPYGHIEFPTAFTPDGNGENDFFRPAAYDGIGEYHLIIYNRWGQVVYETENPDFGWNGKFRGKPAVQDVYAWRVRGKYRNGQPFEKSGSVTLIR